MFVLLFCLCFIQRIIKSCQNHLSNNYVRLFKLPLTNARDIIDLDRLVQWFSTRGTRTASGTRSYFWWYARPLFNSFLTFFLSICINFICVNMSKRKYNEEYIKYGFVSVQHREECLPQCVICMKTLSNSAMKPSLLKRHLESNHSDKKNRGKSYFQRLGENVKRQRLDQTGQSYQKSTGILYSSYEVSLLIVKNMKAHTIAENLVLPAARILVRNLIGEKKVSKLNSVSLSNDTVRRRIQ